VALIVGVVGAAHCGSTALCTLLGGDGLTPAERLQVLDICDPVQARLVEAEAYSWA